MNDACLIWLTGLRHGYLDEVHATQAAELFACECIRVYTSSDVVGVEVGGALKNIFAIAAGELRFAIRIIPLEDKVSVLSKSSYRRH